MMEKEIVWALGGVLILFSCAGAIGSSRSNSSAHDVTGRYA